MILGMQPELHTPRRNRYTPCNLADDRGGTAVRRSDTQNTFCYRWIVTGSMRKW